MQCHVLPLGQVWHELRQVHCGIRQLCIMLKHALVAQAVQEAVQEAVQAAKEEGIKFDVRANLYTLLAISGACRPCQG